MKLKKIILIVSLLFLSGCTINYNLDIQDGKIVETISGDVLKEEISQKEEDTGMNPYYVRLNTDQYPLLDSADVYTKETKEEDGKITYKYQYIYKNNYDKSRILNTCFNDVVFDETEDYYYIGVKGPFICKYSDKVYINVTSKYVILQNNADKVENNTLSWVIDNENDSDMYMVISKNNLYNENKKSFLIPSTFQIVTFIILIILSGVTYFLYYKMNKRNAQS